MGRIVAEGKGGGAPDSFSASASLVKPKEELAALAANLAQIGQACHEIQSVVDSEDACFHQFQTF